MTVEEVQSVSDENGSIEAAAVSIELREEIESESETSYLLKSRNMKSRILEAKNRKEGIAFDEASEKLGL